MPWWGWVLIVVAVAVIVPIKLKVLKIILSKCKQEPMEDDD